MLKLVTFFWHEINSLIKDALFLGFGDNFLKNTENSVKIRSFTFNINYLSGVDNSEFPGG